MGRLAWKIGNGAGSRSLELLEGTTMGWIITILVGALCGWLASIIMKTNAQQGAFLNIIIGIVGSIIAQYVFGTLLKLGGDNAGSSFSFLSILWGVIGSVILIVILKGLRVLR
jgi:uncharacterized membrane protein YeaQ/YmgE (transglycosylase-associated protein family)